MKKIVLLLMFLISSTLTYAQGQNFPGGLRFVSTISGLSCTPGITSLVELSANPYTVYYCSATNTWTALAAGAGFTFTGTTADSVCYYLTSTTGACDPGITTDTKGNISALSVGINGSASSTTNYGSLNNILAWAPGVTISDGSAHLVSGAPAGTPFNGVTTLSGIAAISISGATPFSWITSAPFTGSDYNLTNSSVPNLDIAWLAIQAGLMTGKTYIPAGTYVIGSAINLPLYIPTGNENSGTYAGTQTMIQGGGEYITTIKAGTDFGSGVPLIACGDPSGTSVNTLGRYSNGGSCIGDMQDLSFQSSASNPVFTIGASTIAMTGIAWGARLKTKDIESRGFGKNWDLVGDHTEFIRPHSYGGVFGFYWNSPSAFVAGDLQFIDFLDYNASQAAIAVNPSATIVNSQFDGETYLGETPYAIFGVSGAACGALMQGTRFSRLFMEDIGNALMVDDNNLSASTYTDANKCRVVLNTQVGYLNSSFGNTWLWTAGGRGRRASLDLYFVGIKIDQLALDSGNFNPTTPSSGPSPISTLNVNLGSGSDGVGTKISGDINDWITASGSLPLMTCPSGFCTWNNDPLIEQTGIWSGILANWTPVGSYTTTKAGDVFEGFGSSPEPSGSGNISNPIGIMMQSGVTSSSAWVPFAMSGSVTVNTGWQTFSAGSLEAGTGIARLITITAAGSGGTNGTFTGQVATGGGCQVEPTFSFTVAGGIITAASVTTYGVTCTSAPTLPTSASSGLSGATLTAGWPSGVGIIATTLSDRGILGPSVLTSSPGGGANTVTVALQLGSGANFTPCTYAYGIITQLPNGTFGCTVNGAIANNQGVIATAYGVQMGYLTNNNNFHIFYSGTNPTIASGFGSTPSIPNANGTLGFTVNVGTGGSASTGVITMPAASTGWSCSVSPNGAPQASAVTYSVPTSTTSITLTNYTITTGVALAWTAGSVLQVKCGGY